MNMIRILLNLEEELEILREIDSKVVEMTAKKMNQMKVNMIIVLKEVGRKFVIELRSNVNMKIQI